MSVASTTVQRPIVFDITHVVSRLSTLPSTGIDRIDLAYASHFAQPGAIAAGLHYGVRRPHLLSVEQARDMAALSGSFWSEPRDAYSAAFSDIRNWLAVPPDADLRKPGRHMPRPAASGRLRRFQQLRGRILDNRELSVPAHSIYLNVAQHLFE